jgi:hypothetical protein
MSITLLATNLPDEIDGVWGLREVHEGAVGSLPALPYGAELVCGAGRIATSESEVMFMRRVVQWATGPVGRHAVAAVVDHPDLELVCVCLQRRQSGA